MAYMENEEDVIVDTTNDTEESVETQEETETEGEPEIDVEKLLATNAKLFARAKEAEAKLKELAPKKDQTQTQATPSNVEEVVLLANGMPEELLAQLKKVALVNGTSLIKAQNDPIFVAVKEKFEKDQKREEASLPASRGSSGVKAKKDFSTPGLTREEHMAMFKAQ